MKMPKVLVEAISPFLCLFHMEHTENYVNGSKHARTGGANFFHALFSRCKGFLNKLSTQPYRYSVASHV